MSNSYINTKWRVTIVDIPPHSVKDILFANQMPNAFYIANNNDADIYISLTNTPTKDRHDLMLKRYYSDVFGRPIPTNRLFILNDSNKQISVSVYSAENMFDMSVLKNFKVEIEEAALEAIAYDGIIRGVASGVKIPVDAEISFPPDLEINATFPTDLAVDLKGNALQNLTTVNQNLNQVLTELLNIKTAVEKGGGIATTAKGGTVNSASSVTFNFSEIDFLANDSEDDLTVTITFSGGTTTAVLKKGDTLNDVKIKGSSIAFASGGAINARYLLLG